MNLAFFARALTSFLCCSTLFALAAAGQEPGKGAGFAERRAFEATATSPDDLRQTDHGDGTWSYTLPEGFDPEIRVQGKVFTWRYEGQARFAHEPRPVTGTRKWIATVEEPVEPARQAREMVRIDRQGRRWRVETIDQRAWDASIKADDQGSQENEELPWPRELVDEKPVPPGTVVEWQPQSWSHRNCDSQGGPILGNETHLWEGESRRRVTGPLDEWEKTAVMLTRQDQDGRLEGVCSGVLLRQDIVLTAAHCLSDDANQAVPVDRLRVCRFDGLSCRDVNDAQFPDTYGGGSSSGGGTDFADDWAIVEISNPWTSGNDMNLSGAGDGVLDALTHVHNLSVPGFAPTCGDNSVTLSLFGNREDEPLAATHRKKVRLKIDGTGGHSGSPLYYCPRGDNNVCAPGDKAFVFAVHSGYNTFNKRVVGPKVASFRATAFAMIFD